MAITKSTSVSYLTSSGAEFSTLVDAKYREMADIFLQIFANSGIPTGNNVAQNGASTLGKYFVSINSTTLSALNQSITACRNANP